MKLSYRDKIILTVAVIIITLVLGIFLILKPTIDDYNNNKNILVSKQQQMVDIDAKIAAAQNIDQKIKDAYDSGVELSGFFLPHMDTYETDQFLLPYVAANNITINSLSISEPQVVSMQNYTYRLVKQDYPLLKASDLNNEVDYNTVVGESGKNEQVVRTTVSITCQIPKEENMYGLLDDLDNMPKAIVVTAVQHNIVKDVNAKLSGTLQIDLYSVRQISEPKLD